MDRDNNCTITSYRWTGHLKIVTGARDSARSRVYIFNVGSFQPFRGKTRFQLRLYAKMYYVEIGEGCLVIIQPYLTCPPFDPVTLEFVGANACTKLLNCLRSYPRVKSWKFSRFFSGAIVSSHTISILQTRLTRDNNESPSFFFFFTFNISLRFWLILFPRDEGTTQQPNFIQEGNSPENSIPPVASFVVR